MEILTKAEELKAELDSLRSLDGEAEARIMQKFRFDWNYHSNNLEGNLLTYGETKALILFGITAQGKPLKDHFEITGHNEAINWILEIVKEKTPLTEIFIRQLHTLLLKKDHYVDAVTSEGKPTRRLIKGGKYKTEPNNVITVTGETFYFAAPEETPAKMEELVKWFRKEKEKPDVNSAILAALFHYRFIRIHPFDDGNGRVARILMNFILMQFGYPPGIIKTEDKENYKAVLRLADAGELEPFIEYITQNLIHSLEIMIRGAKGESVEESDDLDKEISLIEQRLKFTQNETSLEVPKNLETMHKVIELSLEPLIEKFILEASKFSRLYEASSLCIYSSSAPHHISEENVIETLKSLVTEDTNFFSLMFQHTQLKNLSLERFGKDFFKYQWGIGINFKLKVYEVFLNTVTPTGFRYEKLYSELLTEKEIDDIISTGTKSHKSFLEDCITEYKNFIGDLQNDLEK